MSQALKGWNNRILVVDDEREVAKSYKEILDPPAKVKPKVRSSRAKGRDEKTPEPSFDFEVVLCHDSETALREVELARHQSRPFAMGFFDVRLGEGMDGFDLVKKIYELDPEIFAVFVTAYNDREVDSIHNLLGADRANRWDYLNKPFTRGEILQKARNFVTLWNLQKEKERHAEIISEMHRKLVESERMTSVAAVARGVGHEFGNILMQIMGKADVSRNKKSEVMSAALESILEASQRAGQILDRFENLSTPVELLSKKESLSILDLLDEALELLEHQFKAKGVKICKVKMDPVVAEVNSTSMIQLIVNLAINSIHAMESSGQIDYSIRDMGQSFEIVVRDYGPGVKPQNLEKILEPFFTTKGEKGTGLGLAICKEIVEIEHHGEFKVQNAVGNGFEVIAKIPKRQAQEVKVA